MFAVSFFLASCAPPEPLDLSLIHWREQKPERFRICHGYGCREKSRVRLSAEEWQRVAAPLAGKAASAEQERQQIVLTVAAMEQIVGAKTGTDADAAGASMFGYDPYQMDCIDEAVNTSLYLRFFADKDLFDWHDVGSPARRGAFIDGEWPHNTAVIRELGSGSLYAVDSWYTANGEAPHIVPLEDWLAGWRPE